MTGVFAIDFGESWCEYNADQVKYGQELKLASCFSINSNILDMLSQLFASPREILRWANWLLLAGRPVTSIEMVDAIKGDLLNEAETLNKNFPNKFPGSFITAVPDVIHMLGALKVNLDDPTFMEIEVSSLLSDLTMADMLWFGFASRAAVSNLTTPGRTGPLLIEIHRRNSVYRHTILAYADPSCLKSLDSFDIRSGMIMTILYIAGAVNFTAFAFSPRTGVSALELGAQSIKKLSLLSK